MTNKFNSFPASLEASHHPLKIPLRRPKSDSAARSSSERLADLITALVSPGPGPHSELESLRASLQKGLSLKSAFAALAPAQQKFFREKIGEKNLGEILEMSAEPDATMCFHNLLHLGVRLKMNSDYERAGTVLGMLSQDRVGSVPEYVKNRAAKELNAILGQGSAGARLEVLADRFSEDATDPRTLAPILAASTLGNLVGAGVLGRLLSTGGEAWYSRGLAARLAAGFAGYTAEFSSFAAANRALTPHSSTSWGDDLWRAALGIGALRGANFLGNRAFLKLHGFEEFGLPSGLSALARFNQVAIPQFAMFTGMIAAHRLEEWKGLRPHTDDATLVTDTLASMLSLQIGMNAASRALGPGFAKFQSELGMRAEEYARRADAARPAPRESLLQWIRDLGAASQEWAVAGTGEPFTTLMSGNSEGNGGPASRPISDVPERFSRILSADIQQIEREFGKQLLEELFGSEKEAAVKHLATLFVNRPRLQEKYSAANFAKADVLERRALLRQLAGDSHSDKVAHEENLGKTRVQTGLFNEAMALFIAFNDHNKDKLEEGRKTPAGPPPGAIVLAQPAIPEPVRVVPAEPYIAIAGEQQFLMPKFKGQYVLGRNEFFGDSTVSHQHLVILNHFGSWALADAGTTFGTSYFDPVKRSWENLPLGQWHPAVDGEVLHIGNTYYRTKLVGPAIDFEPTRLTGEIPPNVVKRFTSITIQKDSYRVQLTNTTWGTEKGFLRIGNLLFQFERGKWAVSDLGLSGGISVNHQFLPVSTNPYDGVIDPNIKTLIKTGDLLKCSNESYKIRVADDGGMTLDKQSAWVEGAPASRPVPEVVESQPAPTSAAPIAPILRPPMVTLDGLHMNSGRVIHIGNTEKALGLVADEGSDISYSLTLEKKPLLGGLTWVIVEYDQIHDAFRIKNLALNSKDVLVKTDGGRAIPVGTGGMFIAQPGDTLIVKGHSFILRL